MIWRTTALDALYDSGNFYKQITDITLRLDGVICYYVLRKIRVFKALKRSQYNCSIAEFMPTILNVYTVTYITTKPEVKALPIIETIPDEGEGEATVPESPIIEMTRKQLYDEIWEISVAGVAKIYDIPYTHLMKQVKEAGIPIHPSGYWTKLSHGKPVTKLDLPEPANETLSIYKIAPATRK